MFELACECETDECEEAAVGVQDLSPSAFGYSDEDVLSLKWTQVKSKLPPSDGRNQGLNAGLTCC